MKISLNWLKDYIKTNISTEALEYKLTMAGLEVENIESVGKDKVYEVEVTPNRADCLNMNGIARELSAILNKNRKSFKPAKIKYPNTKCDIKIQDKKSCLRYIGTLIEGVKIGRSSELIKARLASIGTRPISDLVDITNFVLMETGQPLHAFDYDKLIGGKIVVRRAKKGEKILTLDDEERTLDESILVIADEKRPVAIAGIMGGKETEVTASTKSILLESAYFDPILIRRASRKLGLSSDSSYRFERGVDIEGVKVGSDRACELIKKINGGVITKYNYVKTDTKKSKKNAITLSISRLNSYLGASISKARIQTILKRLDFKVSAKGKDALNVTIPSHRSDILSDVDLIEEVARIEGYDKLPVSLPLVTLTKMANEENRSLRKKIRRTLNQQGFSEIVTYSTTNKESLDKANQGHLFTTKILNPLSLDQEMMRPTLLPSMLSVASFNVNRGQKDLRLFEVGKVYIKNDEIETLGLIMVGKTSSDWRDNNKRNAEFFDIKGALLSSLQMITGERNYSFLPVQDTAYESQSGALIQVDGGRIGNVGKVDEGILNKFVIKDAEVWFAQVNLEIIYSKKKSKTLCGKISAYPAVTRDISLSFDKKYNYEALLKTIRNTHSKILVDIKLKEDYTEIVKEKIPTNHRGILISLLYQSDDRTLQEDEVTCDHQKVLDALIDNLQVSIR